MPEIWAKIEKFEKLIEKIHKFDLTYAFCSHFHWFCPFWLIFYMKYHNVHRVFPYLLSNLWTTTQNALKNTFGTLKWKFHVLMDFCLDLLWSKNIHFLGNFENWSIKYKKTYAHRNISCKISAKTDKICGNESKIHIASQIYGFFQWIFQIFQFLSIFQASEFEILKCGYSQMGQ